MARLPWPLTDRDDLRDELIAAYSTGRGYHDLRHLEEVLTRLDELGAGGDLEVVLAAWFHDAVYDGQPGAEQRSADWAAAALDEAEADVGEVVRLVLLTEDHSPGGSDARGAALCDADLAILASAPARYADYAADVRREYAHVSDADFRAGRRAVLEDLAGREHLFSTEFARTHWEPAARRNLADELASLG